MWCLLEAIAQQRVANLFALIFLVFVFMVTETLSYFSLYFIVMCERKNKMIETPFSTEMKRYYKGLPCRTVGQRHSIQLM